MPENKDSVVTLSTFGEGRRHSRLSPPMTVAELLAEHGVESNGRRVAVNGNVAGLDDLLKSEDEVTVVPRVQGG